MKKFVTSLLVVVGIAANADQAAENVDVNSILYSMPTISGDQNEYQIPTKESFEGAPQFHEDDWCQLEFFAKSRFEEIKEKLSDYKKFELKNRASSGWKEIYVRNIPREAINLDINNLNSLDSAIEQPSPILTTASKPLGQVKNGFTITLGEGALLYGVERNGKILMLAATVFSDEGNQVLVNSLLELDKSRNLILVDWRGQMIIMAGSDGRLGVWKP